MNTGFDIKTKGLGIRIILGFFFITMTGLLFELILTRIFSATMYYHLSFVSISIALFGMSIGALIVYLKPAWFPDNSLPIGRLAYYYAWSLILAILTILCIPFAEHLSLTGFYSMFLRNIIIGVPFILQGILVCLFLTRFPLRVGMLYAVDLIGAGAGCLLVYPLLNLIDAPVAIITAGGLAALASYMFSSVSGEAVYKKRGIYLVALVCLMIVAQSVSIRRNRPLVSIMWSRSGLEKQPLYEKWNPFSRIVVYGSTSYPLHPQGGAMSRNMPQIYDTPQLKLIMDSVAASIITKWDGDIGKLGFLKYDVTNIAHYLRSNSKVLVIGVGGGRDLLSALAFEQKEVIGLEFNRTILGTIEDKFAQFSGNLPQNPKVRLIHDEARSYIARTKERYDIIQVSMIDTWQATSAGAYVLTENGIYTEEAWDLFLSRLTPDGILTFTRWYWDDIPPNEPYRLVTTARRSLEHIGIKDFKRHIVFVKNDVLGSIIISPKPLSDDDLAKLKKICTDMGFEIKMMYGEASRDKVFDEILSAPNLNEYCNAFKANILPTNDNKPFFFLFYRLNDLFSYSRDKAPIFILVALLLTVIILGFLCLILPLRWTKEDVSGSWLYLLYFASIGFGFMLIEISQLQRLIVFLGHPVYSLTVVLFSLLLSSGIGSLISEQIEKRFSIERAAYFWYFLFLMLIIFAFLTPVLTKAYADRSTPVRILIAISSLVPLGFFMGMPFPLGLRLASIRLSKPPLAWFWGINGATSVIASVLGISLAISLGINAGYIAGIIAYAIAGGSFAMSLKRKSV